MQAALVSFAGAFSHGDSRRLDSLFAEPPSFQWYSSNQPGLRSTAAAKNRGTLIRYFRVRHTQRDRLRLTAFTFTGNSHGFGNFTFKMKRSAADFRDGAWFGLIGKGAGACDGSKVRFIVISIGGPGSDKPR
jgi:hypothetical protein